MTAPTPPVLVELVTAFPNVVSEASLVDVTKGPLTQFILTASSEDVQTIENIWSSLLHTFSSTILVPSHRSTICNAINAFLESCSQSSVIEIQDCGLSQEKWFAVFDVFLDRYEDSKPKSMRQVLKSLISVLKRHPDQNTVKAILDNVIPRVTSTIVLAEPQSRVKASMATLEWLMRRDALKALKLLSYAKEWFTNRSNYLRWIYLWSSYCYKLNIPLSHFSGKTTPTEGMSFYTAQLFTACLIVQAINLQILPSAGSLITLLCHKLRAGSLEVPSYPHTFSGSPFWLAPALQTALSNLEEVSNLSDHVFFPLVKEEPEGFERLIYSLPFESLKSGISSTVDANELTLLFSLLSTAKELGMVHEDTEFRVSEFEGRKSYAYVLKSSTIGKFITHTGPAVRLSALSLIINTLSTTKPLSYTALQVLKNNLPLVYSDGDPQYRGEMFALLRKLIIRLRGGLVTLRKAFAAKLDMSIIYSTSREDHLDFLTWCIEFFRHELHPAASYQRHISALRALILMAGTGLDKEIEKGNLNKLGNDQVSWAVTLPIFRTPLFLAASNLLADPFEDVRNNALTLLSMFPREILKKPPPADLAPQPPFEYTLFALGRAEIMASQTSRADHADTVAKLFKFLFDIADIQSYNEGWMYSKNGVVRMALDKIRSRISLSEADSIRDNPLHGYVTALRYIVSTPFFCDKIDTALDYREYANIHRCILKLCGDIWNTVRGILCVDSPEGEYGDDSSEEIVGPKDLLSCSWRALRESSLLLHAVLSNPTYAPFHELAAADFATIGNLAFTQLAELRHRGAFSTVSQTFATCCQRCGAASDPDVRALPEEWYARISTTIDEQSSRLTRRSAGLPALVTGVSMFQPGGPLFSRIMADMQRIGSSEPEDCIDGTDAKLPQVHALNALKDLFTNTKLGPYTEPYIPACLEISSDCLGSPLWAIRNCGLMLFRALMIRMCKSGGSNRGFGGESGAEPGNRVDFGNWKTVGPLLEKLLGEEQETKPNKQPQGKLGELRLSTEKVFPALELIGEKVPPSPGQDDSALRKLVARHFASPVWAIRDQAARIFASLTRITEVPEVIEPFVSADVKKCPANQLHGQALCIRYSLARVWHSTQGYWRSGLDRVLDVVPKVFSNYCHSEQRPFVVATVVEVLNDAMICLVKCGKDDVVQELYEDVISPADFSLLLHGKISPSKGHFHRSSTLLFRAFIHSTLIVHLTSPLSEDEPDFLASAAVEEIDSCRTILELIHQNFGDHVKSRATRFGLYISIISQDSPVELVHTAMDNMAKELSMLFSTESAFPDELSHVVQWADIADIEENDGEIWDRDMSNASLHLQGCLLALRMGNAGDILFFKRCIPVYAAKLRFAVKDLTEYSTRLAAVNSLKAFFSGLRSYGIKQWEQNVFLEIYMVVYDLMHDDDEDIREIAACIACWVLSDDTSHTRMGVVSLSPLAAGDEFRSFLCTTFADSKYLFLQACSRLVGVSDAALEKFPSMQAALQQHRECSTALFEEEKQNLFIDEVREADRWSDTLTRFERGAVDSNLLAKLYEWADDGLNALFVLTLAREVDGVLGMSSKVEIFTLGLKIFHTVRALLHIWGDVPYDRNTLYSHITSFSRSGGLMTINPVWHSVSESLSRPEYQANPVWLPSLPNLLS